MTCPTLTIQAVAGTSDPRTLVFGTHSQGSTSAYDFSSVTRMVASLRQDGSEVDVADSDTDTGVFDWSNGDGELVVDFGVLVGIQAGTYQVRLTYYEGGGSPILLNRDDGNTFDLVVSE